MTPAALDRTRGVLAGVGAYLIWGFIAEYFRLLGHRGVVPMTLLAHRVVWSMLFCLLLMAILRSTRDFWNVLREPRRACMLAISSVMLSVNWLTFIYSIETNQLAQSALGYFMTPLVTVLLALVVLRERLRSLQWVAIGLATIGVGIILLGQTPWIALSIAFSFGFYGLIRKTTAVPAITGLAVETAVLTPVALAYIAFLTTQETTRDLTPGTYGLLMLAGVITAVPLLLFAFAARALKLSTIGFLQYLAPILQLLVALYHGEPFTLKLALGFIPIWLGLLLFSTDAAMASRRESETRRREGAKDMQLESRASER